MRESVNDIEKEYWMTRKQKIKALIECFGYTRKEAIAWLDAVKK